MRHRAIMVVSRSLFVLLLGLLVGVVPVQSAKKCSDCHKADVEAFMARRIKHEPMTNDNCESCHKRHGFSQRLSLVATDNSLCLGCHADLQASVTTGNVHAPVAKGVCWDCHDPHSSDKKNLLRPVPQGNDDPASCLLCHQDVMQQTDQAAHRHRPVTERNCLACHQPHASPHNALLVSEGEKLCMTCHTSDAVAMQKAHVGRHTEALACLDCHSGHHSATKGLLSETAHPPFAEGDCESCHSLPDSAGSITFAGGTDKNTLCGVCHDEQAAAPAKAVVHPAVSADNCSDCHQPHNSRNGSLLRDTEGAVCAACHTDIAVDTQLTTHTPVLQGQCSGCHEVHGSDSTGLLKMSGADLCLGCHTSFAAARDSAGVHHAAADNNCLSCHSPHQGIGPGLLKKQPDQLCAECHAPDQRALTARSGHLPYLASNCSACHDPHFSRAEHLVRSDKPDLCLSCHGDIGSQLKLAHAHDPATDDCLGCHSPHYASAENLLSEPPELLCLTCHDAEALGLRSTHVHSAARAADCNGCHNPHGSEHGALLAIRTVSTLADGRTPVKPKPLTSRRASLCYACHDEFGDRIEKSAAHKPVKDGQCEVCHAAHGSAHPGVVSAPAPQLCLQCHTVDSSLASSHGGYAVAGSDCLDCHNPHLSSKANLVRELAHPPFAEGSCSDCHSQKSDGSIELAENMTDLCATCHDQVDTEMGLPSQHAPFASGECTSCHRVHTADQPKMLIDTSGALCLTCHETMHRPKAAPSTHPPFAQRNCLACHAPHASGHTGLLVSAPDSLCFGCHTELLRDLKGGPVHEPVRSGSCNSCHLPHDGQIPALLVSDKQQLCGSCHDPTTAAMATAHRQFDLSAANCQNCHAPHVGAKGKSGLLLPRTHEPFASGTCAECHTSKNPKDLVRSNRELCLTCHADFAARLAKPVVHPALEDSSGCAACHGPHVGFGSGLLRKEGARQCLTCHQSSEFTGKHRHAPAFDDCGTCHDPHASDSRMLLASSDITGLCENCHADARKTHFHPMGSGVIDPRTKADLTCTGCHSAHSSNEPGLLIAERTRKLCNNCHNTARH